MRWPRPGGAIDHAAGKASTRTNAMLTSVAGVAAQAPPGATHSRATKTVTIDTIKLDGSNPIRPPMSRLPTAFSGNATWAGDDINNTVTPAETTAWIAPIDKCKAALQPDQRRAAAFKTGANARFGLTARIRAFDIQSLSTGSRAESCIPSGSLALVSRVSWVRTVRRPHVGPRSRPHPAQFKRSPSRRHEHHVAHQSSTAGRRRSATPSAPRSITMPEPIYENAPSLPDPPEFRPQSRLGYRR